MSRLIDADALYERACSLEAQAMDYVRKLTERDGDKVSVEWKIWSVALTERTAFKHDIFDAPTVEERKRGEWVGNHEIGIFSNPDSITYKCSECGYSVYTLYGEPELTNYCPNCGADMRGEE